METLFWADLSANFSQPPRSRGGCLSIPPCLRSAAAAIARSETPAVIRALVEAGVEIEEARWIGADLEDVFMTETGWTGVQTGAAKGAAHAG